MLEGAFKSLIFTTLIKFKDVKKSIFLSALFFLSFQFGFSQVQSVDYSLRFNSETCLFDCYLIINEGKTKSTVSRAQFNSQVTIVVPAKSNVFVEESYMPLRDNQSYRSGEAVPWEITNELERPADLKDSRLVSISPILAPTAFYNDIEQGDEIKLFSLKVNPIVNCADGVRLFDNQKDPSSVEKGMMGADFSNGFTIGGVEQKYAANSKIEMPKGPLFSNLDTRGKYGIDFKASSAGACQSSLSFQFFGPKGLIGSFDDYYAYASKNNEIGEYKVIATDNLGCSSEHKFYPYGKEENTNAHTRISESDGMVEALNSSIFPNPSQDVVNLIVSGKEGTQVEADIFDLDGKLVKSSVAQLTLTQQEQTVKIRTGLTPGVYNLALNVNQTEVVNHKLIIIK